MLPLTSVRSERRAALGMLMSLLSLASYREYAPFMNEANNILLTLAQYILLLTFGSGLAIETDVSKGLSPLMLGIILVAINVSVIFVALAMASARARREQKHVGRWRRELSTQEIAMLEAVMQGTDSGNSEAAARLLGRQSSGDDDANAKSRAQAGARAPGIQQRKHQDLLERHLVKASDVVLEKRIGAGAFGEVFRGKLKGQPAAIKTMLEVTEENAKAFRAEILLTGILRHPNVVTMLGCCWERGLTVRISSKAASFSSSSPPIPVFSHFVWLLCLKFLQLKGAAPGVGARRISLGFPGKEGARLAGASAPPRLRHRHGHAVPAHARVLRRRSQRAQDLHPSPRPQE